jgi:VCBS repeat-containing protein
VANPVTASSTLNTVSLRLDPAVYADHSVVVTIEKISGGLGGPVLSELVLSDIRYCYRDSGGPGEQAYQDSPDGCGWLNGSIDQTWGTLPYQSVRFNEGSPLRYRFDRLAAGKNYRLALTFFDGGGSTRTQAVSVDGLALLSNVVPSPTPQFLSEVVPAAAYAADGSIVVEIGGPAQPIISEIALEELTSVASLRPNQPPLATADQYKLVRNRLNSVPAASGVLKNDQDLENSLLTAVLETGPTHGTLTLDSNGGFLYTPQEGYIGVDSFTYRASDGVLTSTPVSVTLLIQAVIYLPVTLR